MDMKFLSRGQRIFEKHLGYATDSFLTPLSWTKIFKSRSGYEQRIFGLFWIKYFQEFLRNSHIFLSPHPRHEILKSKEVGTEDCKDCFTQLTHFLFLEIFLCNSLIFDPVVLDNFQVEERGYGQRIYENLLRKSLIFDTLVLDTKFSIRVG